MCDLVSPAGLPSAASPEIVHEGWEVKRPWFQRDVPLSFDVIMENLTDPAHVAHSHHGVIVGDPCSAASLSQRWT